MTFGQIIKKLRHDADMTQERLAELLCISPQAVSRWETGAAMPDISLLPPLANLFHVTTDYLLGVDIQMNEERVEKIIRAANKEANKNVPERWQLAAQVIREGLKLYPDNWKLKSHLVLYLRTIPGSPEDRTQNLKEINTICEDILANCPDQQLRYSAISCICGIALATDNRERALELARTMPHLSDCQEFLLDSLLEGDQWITFAKNFIHYLLLSLDNTLYRLSANRPKDIVASLYHSSMQIEAALYKNEDYRKRRFLTGGKVEWALQFAQAADYDMALSLLEQDIERMYDITEHPFTGSDFLAPEHLLRQLHNVDLPQLREEAQFLLESDLDYLDHHFPDAIKRDPRFEEVKGKMQEFLQRSGSHDA